MLVSEGIHFSPIIQDCASVLFRQIRRGAQNWKFEFAYPYCPQAEVATPKKHVSVRSGEAGWIEETEVVNIEKSLGVIPVA